MIAGRLLSAYHKKIYGKKLKELLQAVYASGNMSGLAGLIECMEAWEKLEWVSETTRQELLLYADSEEAETLWLESLSEQDCIEFADLMKCNAEILSRTAAFRICVAAWNRNNIEKEQIIQVIEWYSQMNLKCPDKVLLQLAFNTKDKDWNLLKNLVLKYSEKVFSDKPMTRYPQNELQPKVVKKMEMLVDSALPLDKKIFMYMNTSLREESQIDKFFVMLKEHRGIAYGDCLKELRNYWMVGILKYISEDGFVRVIPGNISATRLVSFWSKNIHIVDENGIFVEPHEGDKIYFLLKKYDEERNCFSIHYPCMKPMDVKAFD